MTAAHGTRASYIAGCCCPPCTDANRRYGVEYRALLRRHRPSGFVDAAPVLEHVAALRAAGVGRGRIAERSGVPESTLLRLLGYRGPVPTRILRTSAEAILAVSAGDAARVCGVGTARRLQALCAIGYSQRRLASLSGLNASRVNEWVRGRGEVTRVTEQRVRDLYDRLSMVPMVGRGPAMSRTAARRNGWVSPLAWVYVDIDDPAAAPDLGSEDPVSLESRADRRDRCAALLAAGCSVAEAAREAGVSERTAERARARWVAQEPAEEAS